MKKFCFIVFCFAYQQRDKTNSSIKGTIKSADTESLPGATI
jgi:hypothetical protein